MARTNSVNYTGANQFPMANAAADIFKKEDVQVLAKAVDAHVHDGAGLGLPVAFTGVPAGSIPGTALANGAVTSAKIADGTIATVDLADASVSNAKLGSDTARANLLTNGGFEIWQRSGPFNASGLYFADRWRLTIAAGSATATRDTTNVDTGSTVSAAIAWTKSGGSVTEGIYQSIKPADGQQIANRTVSFSCRVKTNVANAVRIGINNVHGASFWNYGAYHTGDNTWQTLSVTVALDPAITEAQIYVLFDASCTAYLDNAMLVVGSQYADYAPLHPADDQARCLRYYQRWQPGSGSQLVGSGFAYAATGAWIVVPLNGRLGGTPTATVSNVADWGLASGASAINACTAINAGLISNGTFSFQATCASGLTVGQGGGFFTVNANAWYAQEYNP